MIRSVSDLQYIREAILTIPVSQLPIIAVSYPTPSPVSRDVSAESESQPAYSHAVVSAVPATNRISRLELLA